MITVAGKDEEKNEEILKNIEEFLPEQKNMKCAGAGREEVENAHKAGLSLRKYRAFLEVKANNPDITPEDVKGLTMRQIRELAEEYQGEKTEDSGKSNRNPGKNRQETKEGNGERRERKRKKKIWKKLREM